MALEVLGIDHLYVTVGDLARSEPFYDQVFRLLGFRKGTRPIADEAHAHYFNRVMQYTLRPARPGSAQLADAYAVGAVHHLCFRVRDIAAVDVAHRSLRALGIEASAPRLHPEYRPDYYATFFSDPDDIRLEIVCDTEGRRLVRERYAELDEFVDPVQRLLERDRLRRTTAPDPSACVQSLWDAATPEQGESFETLAEFPTARIERIVSSAAPESDAYDQPHDEWVVLLRGEARLQIAGREHELGPGDYVKLPAHTHHRVLSATAGALWLAVHGT